LRNPGGISDVTPGLVGLTLLFSTTSMAAIVIAFEKRIDALERLLLAPLSMKTLIFGKALGSSDFGAGMGAVVLAFESCFLQSVSVKRRSVVPRHRFVGFGVCIYGTVDFGVCSGNFRGDDFIELFSLSHDILMRCFLLF
jgi:hypothetical protein